MSEPLLPTPGPEPHSHWDPEPARCPDCRNIVELRRDGAEWLAWCPQHGRTEPVYDSDYQPDNEPDEDRDE